MEIREIRDKLLIEKTRYEQSLARSKQTISDIAGVLDTITEDQVALCKEYGINLEPLLNINVDRLMTDAEYREKCRNEQQAIISQMHKLLEEALDV